MDETWQSLWQHAVALFLREPQNEQFISAICGLIVVALVLQGISSLIPRRRDATSEAPSPVLEPSFGTEAKREARWQPHKISPTPRKRGLDAAKRFRAPQPVVLRLGSAAIPPVLAAAPPVINSIVPMRPLKTG